MDGLREWHGNTPFTVCKTVGICCMSWGPRSMLCDTLEGWDGVEDGKDVQEGGDICIPMADPC